MGQNQSVVELTPEEQELIFERDYATACFNRAKREYGKGLEQDEPMPSKADMLVRFTNMQEALTRAQNAQKAMDSHRSSLITELNNEVITLTNKSIRRNGA